MANIKNFLNYIFLLYSKNIYFYKTTLQMYGKFSLKIFDYISKKLYVYAYIEICIVFIYYNYIIYVIPWTIWKSVAFVLNFVWVCLFSPCCYICCFHGWNIYDVDTCHDKICNLLCLHYWGLNLIFTCLSLLTFLNVEGQLDYFKVSHFKKMMLAWEILHVSWLNCVRFCPLHIQHLYRELWTRIFNSFILH